MAWALVVVVGAGGSWYAIDQAGGAVAPDTTTLSPVDPAQPPADGSTGSGTPVQPSSTASSGPTASPTATGTGSPAATPQRRTWTGAAGVVVASCTDGVLRFVSAQPADGWRVERDDDGDVNVTFERAEQEVRVRADCVAGRPEFDVKTER